LNKEFETLNSQSEELGKFTNPWDRPFKCSATGERLREAGVIRRGPQATLKELIGSHRE